MHNLLNIILKNFRLLIRNKSSALIVIFGPLILIFLIGMAFNTSSLHDLRLGVYTSSYSDLTNSLIDDLDEEFIVIELDDEQYCIDGVKSNEFNVCAVIPPNLKIGSDDEIVFYADYSRINIVYNIISTISSKLDVRTSEISTNLTGDLLQKLNTAKVTLLEKKTIVNSLKQNTEIATTELDSVKQDLKNLDLDDLKDENDTAGINSDVDKLASEINDTINSITIIQDSLKGNSDQLADLNSAMSNIISAASGLQLTEAEDIVTPVKTRIEPLTIDESHLNYLFPALLVLVVMLISILLGSTTLINEKSTFAYFRNFITPANDIIFLIGNFLSNFLVVILEIAIILGLSLVFFGTGFLNTALLTLFILSIGAIVFVLLGMIIGYGFRSSETANLASISVASLMLFFSNTILPLESLPSFLRGLAILNPFVILESMLKKTILFGAPLADHALGFLILVGYIMLFGLLAYLVDEATKRRL